MKILDKDFLKRVYKINPEIQKKIRVIKDGEVIFTHEQIDKETGIFKNEINKFNNMASGILFWIYESASLSTIHKDIIQKFKVDTQRAEKDLIEFIKKLEAAGFIELISD